MPIPGSTRRYRKSPGDPSPGEGVTVVSALPADSKESFFEIRSSTPFLDIARAGSVAHVRSTFHFQGPWSELDKISRATLRVSLREMTEPSD